jgi:hypothetical protein
VVSEASDPSGWRPRGSRVSNAQDEFFPRLALCACPVTVGAHFVNGDTALDLTPHVAGQQIALQQVNSGVEKGRVKPFREQFQGRRGFASCLMIGTQVMDLVDFTDRRDHDLAVDLRRCVAFMYVTMIVCRLFGVSWSTR